MIPRHHGEKEHPVQLTLDISNHTNWNVKSQPGAVRRVVMNLLGNALKYTYTGSINVSLKPDDSRKEDDSHLHALLSVTDTGKGMSGEYVKNYAFTAFSQENSLSSGTGLGLSIVRQIVDSLGGRIDLTSEQNVGTDIEIWLSLPSGGHGQSDDDDDSILTLLQTKTKDLELTILEPPIKESKVQQHPIFGLSEMPSVGDSVKQMLANWFEMKVTTAPSMRGCSPNFFMYLEPPPISWLIHNHGTPLSHGEIPVLIICTNAFEAASLRSKGIHLLTDIGRIIEVIPQPLGPQKMANALLRCMQRLRMLNDPDIGKSAAHVPMIAGQQSIYDTLAKAPQSSHTSQGQPGRNWQWLTRGTSQGSYQPRTEERSSPENAQMGETGSEDVPDAHTKNDQPPLPHVLVVDDNQINLNLLVAFVRRTKHPFDSAVDGAEALTAYKRSVNENGGANRFKYILMDISMPVMDGIASTKAIRQFEREKKIESPATIIALTGLGNESAQQDAYRAGFDQFLSKPVVSHSSLLNCRIANM
jgi:CheY-like chemotaxis protein